MVPYTVLILNQVRICFGIVNKFDLKIERAKNVIDLPPQVTMCVIMSYLICGNIMSIYY